MTLVCCGHPAPLIIGGDGTLRRAEPHEPAPPLGLTDLAGIAPRPYGLPFAPGDQMLPYTGGDIEARDENGRFYPLEDRVFPLQAAGAEEALEDLRADLVRHTGGPIADDAAKLLVRHR